MSSEKKNIKTNWPKRILFVIGMLVSFITVVSLYNIFFSPLDGLPKIEQVEIEKIPDSENAWRDYELAIKNITDEENFQQSAKDFPSMEAASKGLSPLEESHKAYLDKHINAVNYIVGGSSRPKAQFQTGHFDASMKIPGVLQTRALTNLATLQARRLVDEGKLIEATQMDLAAFKMATNFSAEAHASLIACLISASSRQQVAGALFYLMSQEKIEATSLAAIAKGIQADDSRLLSPLNYQSNEWKAIQNSVYDMTIGEKFTEIPEMALPYGLRARIYQYLIQTGNKIFESKRSGLEKWDFKALEQAENNQDAIIEDSPLGVGSYLGRPLLYSYVSTPLTSIKTDYCSRVITQAAQINAAYLAYKKTHGKLPENLEIAFAELGLKVPVDFATSKPVNYKIDGEKGIIWFAGVDGKDDGGKSAYSLEEQKKPTEGKDYVFTLGEMPGWLKEQK